MQIKQIPHSGFFWDSGYVIQQEKSFHMIPNFLLYHFFWAKNFNYLTTSSTSLYFTEWQSMTVLHLHLKNGGKKVNNKGNQSCHEQLEQDRSTLCMQLPQKQTQLSSVNIEEDSQTPFNGCRLSRIRRSGEPAISIFLSMLPVQPIHRWAQIQ